MYDMYEYDMLDKYDIHDMFDMNDHDDVMHNRKWYFIDVFVA